jgi:hypothetical protein
MPWVEAGIISKFPKPRRNTGAIVAVSNTPPPLIPYAFNTSSISKDIHLPHHSPHLANFFDAIRDKNVKLNCPAEVGYQTAVMVLKVNEAVKAGKKLEFKDEDFHV